METGADAGRSATVERGFAAPRTLDEAVALLAAGGAGARAFAGGTDLLVQMRTGVVRPGLLVDLKRIPECTALALGPEGLRIGAATPAAALREHPEIGAVYPGLVEAAALIGSEQIQSRASLGGNLCNASPAADTVPALLAAEASCVIAGPGGRRTVPVESFCTGPATTVLEPGEFLVELWIPPPGPRSADAYLRLTPRSEMDIAVVGAAARLTLDPAGRCTAARLVLGAVAPTAILVPAAAQALVGQPVDESALERVAAAARQAARPIDDARGTVAYRRRVAGVLARRATRIAAQRAVAASGRMGNA